MSITPKLEDPARHTITVGRSQLALSSHNSLGTAALNAIAAIPGAFDVQVESETEESAVVSYVWKAAEKFWRTEEHLNARGLRRVDWL